MTEDTVTKARGMRVMVAAFVEVGTLARFTVPRKVLHICWVFVTEVIAVVVRPRSSTEVLASITRPRTLKSEAVFILKI